jgi:hypothetical protein
LIIGLNVKKISLTKREKKIKRMRINLKKTTHYKLGLNDEIENQY